MNPICVTHACEFKIHKNGFDVLEKHADDRPYRVRSGDAYVCPVGGESIVSGFGSPIYPDHPAFERDAGHADLTVAVA
jgi:hypothetical protein